MTSNAIENIKIPKVIFQISKNNQDQYVVDMIKSRSPGWEYKHFKDDDVLQFFKENPLDEFPNIKDKFLSIISGAHRADLFRYYYLYFKGGVYLDSDAMIEQDINTIVKDYDFFSVESTYIPNTIFNGFIWSTPKNIIIHEALKHAYISNPVEINKNDMIFCKRLKEIYDIFKEGQKTTLYLEQVNNSKSSKVVNKRNETICIRYYRDKIIPDVEKYRSMIKQNEKKKIGITIAHVKSIMNLFSNGIIQNAIFFYDLLTNIGKYDVYFIVDGNDNDYLTELKYKQVHIDRVTEECFSIIFTFCFRLSLDKYFILNKMGTKNIFYNCGNIFILESETCLYNGEREPNYQKFNIFDECWNIPQHFNTNHYYLKTLLRCNIVQVPFIWSPQLIDNEENKYKKRTEIKSLAIFEPNISIIKWSFPPLLVCENAYRAFDVDNKDKIKNVYIMGVNDIKNFNKNNFLKLVNYLDLGIDNKITIENRHRSLYIMSNYADIAVSHTWENYLNYLYFDIAWMGWPIVHNGKLCKEVGYYYDEFNYEEGGRILKDVILHHDEHADEYLLRNRSYLQKFLPTNVELQKKYDDLITGLLHS